MRVLRLLSLSAALFALAACETVGPPMPPPPPRQVVFSPDQFMWSTQQGTGGIDGRVLFRTRESNYSCSNVGLIPDAPWMRQRMMALYGSTVGAAVPAEEVRARSADAPTADFSGFVRNATCDASNRFSFSGLPPGGWFVIVAARPTGSGPPMALMRRVTTRNGRTAIVEF